jgi:hypothetical protein
MLPLIIQKKLPQVIFYLAVLANDSHLGGNRRLSPTIGNSPCHLPAAKAHRD